MKMVVECWCGASYVVENGMIGVCEKCDEFCFDVSNVELGVEPIYKTIITFDNNNNIIKTKLKNVGPVPDGEWQDINGFLFGLCLTAINCKSKEQFDLEVIQYIETVELALNLNKRESTLKFNEALTHYLNYFPDWFIEKKNELFSIKN